MNQMNKSEHQNHNDIKLDKKINKTSRGNLKSYNKSFQTTKKFCQRIISQIREANVKLTRTCGTQMTRDKHING